MNMRKENDSGLIEAIPGDVAWSNLASNPAARWPTRGDAFGRLNGVASPHFEPGFRLEPDDTIFTVGSCFARNIEAHLAALGFEVPAIGFQSALFKPKENLHWLPPNTELNKYSPFSILNEFQWALDVDTPFDAENGFLEIRPGEWIDPQVWGNDGYPLAAVTERRRAITDLFKRVTECRVLIMTLGLVETWYDRLTERYLNRFVPKSVIQAFPGRFELRVLDYSTIRDSLEQIFDLLKRKAHPQLRVVLSVSPVPIGMTFRDRDVLSANTYSKSVLRSVTEEIVRDYPFVDYFPSYESVMLSDPERAWEDDLIHVRDEMVRFNVQRMIQAYMPGTPAVDAGLLFLSGQRKERRKEYAEAEALYRQATGLAPDRHDILCQLGYVLSALGKVGDAIDVLQSAHDLAPDDSNTLYRLGVARMMSRDDEAAMACFRKSLALDPKQVHAYFQLASLQRAAGRHAEALDSIDRALMVMPDNASFHAFRGKCLADLRQFEGAAAAYANAVRLDPAQPAYREQHAIAVAGAAT